MEREGHFAFVGAIFILVLAGLVWFAFFIARADFNPAYDHYDILFTTRAKGLAVGVPVNINGIRAGQITEVGFQGNDPNRILARAEITAGLPIRTDAAASLQSEGVTAVYFVEITPGKPPNPLLNSTVGFGKTPIIPGTASTLADLLTGGGDAIDQTRAALVRVNRLLSDENLQTFSAALSDVQALTAEARDRRAIIADAQAALHSIDKAAREISELSHTTKALVDSDGRRTLMQLGDAAAELKGAAAQTRTLVEKLDAPTSEFATTGLPQLNDAITTLQGAAASLDRLTTAVERDPRGTLGKGPAKEKELQP